MHCTGSVMRLFEYVMPEDDCRSATVYTACIQMTAHVELHIDQEPSAELLCAGGHH